MFLTRSIKQKIAATCGAVIGFVLFYEVTMLDSRVTAAKEAEIRETTAKPAPGLRLRFTSTAYCKGTTTASGTAVQTGIAAADPDLLPVGSVIQIDSLGTRYNGIYTIMDTGPAVQGRHIDLYMWSCNEALAFGRKPMALNVLRLGWNPRASSPGAIRSQFNQREQEQKANADALSKVSDASSAGTPVAVPPAAVPAATSPVVKSPGVAATPVQQASVASRQ
jgi:3D (Asp-Asp-Asp) domain-containing protein